MSGCRKFIALLVVGFATSNASALAQPESRRDLATVLVPGRTVWITDSAGRKEKSRIVSLSNQVVTLTADHATRSLSTADVVRVDAQRPDSLINGALIGAGAAVASGLLLCTLTETWENCSDDAGPMLRIGAIGAGAGIAIDALIRRRTTVYEAPRAGARLLAAPILARGARGLRISVSF
jgi:hypothetical protein